MLVDEERHMEIRKPALSRRFGGALLAALSVSLGACVSAGADDEAAQASALSTRAPYPYIPFVSHGGIQDWRPDGDNGLYVQDTFGHWYYAKLFAPCLDLQFAERIGFVAEPDDSFDRFSAIEVHRHRCEVSTL